MEDMQYVSSYRRRRRGINLPKVDKLKLLSWGVKLGFAAILLGIVGSVGAFAFYSRQIPDPNSIVRKEGFSTQIFDRTGEKILYDVYVDQNRQFTPLADMPDYLLKATVAIEDKDFYKHQGFDPLAALRIAKNVITRQRLIGGSTLTQQLVKNVLLTNERKLSRKIKELVLAVQIERKFSKDEILQMYLNEAPYGGTAWGIAAASEQYFSKKPKDLTLTEAVILAGMPQSPTRFSPYGKNPLAYVARATDVARRMREDGYISKEQEKEIVDSLTMVGFQKGGNSIKAPHFVMYVKDILEEDFGEELVQTGGLKVTTSLDYDLQQAAEKIVQEEIDKVAGPMHITNGASMIMDTESGEVLSMVGSRNFFDDEHDGQVNVTLSLRQPGSTIKPVTYATAFAEGYWPGKVIADVVTQFPSGDPEDPYEPVNYDGKEHGLVNLRNALGNSLNIPAVKLLALVGVEDTLKTAHAMGFESLEPTRDNMRRLGLSVTLGGGEVRLLDMVAAYSAFANGGNKTEPVSILKVEDSNGKVIYEAKSAGKKRVLDEKVAFLVNSVLSDNNARLITFSANSLLNIPGRNVAVKTGTTNDRRDNWTVGWTKKVIVGVWVGNNDNSQMKQVASGISGASPIWRRQMMEALSKYEDPEFTAPEGVEQVDLDVISGYPAHDNFPSYKEWVIKGSVPTGEDPIHRMVPVCSNDSGRLASDVQVAQGNFDRKEFIVIKEQDPLTGDDTWQKAIDAWLANQTEEKYKVPTQYCDQLKGVHVEILNPRDRTRLEDNNVTIEATVVSDKKIEWADLYIDGNKELRFTERPYKKEFFLDNGVHKIRIVARNEDGVESDRIHTFGVKTEWNADQATPTPTPPADDD